ncbi:TPA: hypothetical protein DCQ44_02490 [Candidatus Taylorbacteria bacterium]|nr:hypothetical protein [Candidatus Taylorbacteria bacterium]
MKENYQKAYVVAVDMGYGHQRAAFPLLNFTGTPDEWNIDKPMIISANNYPGIPNSDKSKWSLTQRTYEFVSRMNGFPLLGKRMFRMMDYFQRIEPFYPKHDMSKPTMQTKQIYRMIKHGMGRHLIEVFNKKPLPLICTFPIPAFFAEEHGYKGEIYCLCTDTDVSRAWAPLHPEKSRIIYLAPTMRAKERLELYGVQPEKIVLTGFPIPDDATLSSSLYRRIIKLDPFGVYRKKHQDFASFKTKNQATTEEKPLTITFAVGGAGAQWKTGVDILNSLKTQITKGTIRVNLVAGASKRILSKFERSIKKLGLEAYRDRGVSIIYRPDKFEYFTEFNQALCETDVLWTKPSELSFYVGLGIPIIMTPPLGSQEECNKAWLHMVGAGFEQYDPKFTAEWLADWLSSGWLAEAAARGFLNAPLVPSHKQIEELVLHGKIPDPANNSFI